ncbi:hypothetical protein [Nonomuraea sp. NPDC050691]|uniref:hypothetical protein n=1 Tax=Nonomuraea sp. NPDC050691 TaxID=3155661 RepID=UPI00340F84D3
MDTLELRGPLIVVLGKFIEHRATLAVSGALSPIGAVPAHDTRSWSDVQDGRSHAVDHIRLAPKRQGTQ